MVACKEKLERKTWTWDKLCGERSLNQNPNEQRCMAKLVSSRQLDQQSRQCRFKHLVSGRGTLYKGPRVLICVHSNIPGTAQQSSAGCWCYQCRWPRYLMGRQLSTASPCVLCPTPTSSVRSYTTVLYYIAYVRGTFLANVRRKVKLFKRTTTVRSRPGSMT